MKLEQPRLANSIYITQGLNNRINRFQGLDLKTGMESQGTFKWTKKSPLKIYLQNVLLQFMEYEELMLMSILK